MKTLEHYTIQEHADLAQEMGGAYGLLLLDLQKECYERHAKTMMTPKIAEWVEAMAGRYTTYNVKVHNIPVSWAAALLVVRYGGSPKWFPPKFTEQDEQRAHLWFLGRNVPAVEIITT